MAERFPRTFDDIRLTKRGAGAAGLKRPFCSLADNLARPVTVCPKSHFQIPENIRSRLEIEETRLAWLTDSEMIPFRCARGLRSAAAHLIVVRSVE